MFDWIKEWFRKRKREKASLEEELREPRENAVLHRDRIDLHDQAQRGRYIEGCLEQMKDAEKEIDALTREYTAVTYYLTDMEELEALPPEEKRTLTAIAERISNYEREKNIYEEDPTRMSEKEFRRIERMEDEVEEGLRRLTETEEYQDRIKMDLQRLAGERHAYAYRKNDLHGTMANMRGMMVICAFSFVLCMIILLLLQLLLEMDVQIGYILMSGIMALAIFLIYMKYTDAAREKERVERTINKLILLQNRVKIRYINNTNLLDYLYMKYNTDSAEELGELWERYQEEKEERAKFQALHAELDEARRELLRALRRYQIKAPEIWLRQTLALINKHEMVEIRHNLILRRQKLRKQMEYNESLAAAAQGEIKSLAEEFPAYAPEIMEMVSRFELENEGR